MYKIKELLSEIEDKLGKGVLIVICSDDSFGLVDFNLKPISLFDEGNIEQELEEYLESLDQIIWER